MEFSEYLQWDRLAPFLRHPVYRRYTGWRYMSACVWWVRQVLRVLAPNLNNVVHTVAKSYWHASECMTANGNSVTVHCVKQHTSYIIITTQDQLFMINTLRATGDLIQVTLMMMSMHVTQTWPTRGWTLNRAHNSRRTLDRLLQFLTLWPWPVTFWPNIYWWARL